MLRLLLREFTIRHILLIAMAIIAMAIKRMPYCHAIRPYNSPVFLWFDLGLIAREGFSTSKNVLYNILSLKKSSEGKA